MIQKTIQGHNKENSLLSRRSFLKSLGRWGSMSFLVGSGLIYPSRLQIPGGQHDILPPHNKGEKYPPSLLPKKYPVPELSLSLYNTHTGESLKNHVFWVEGHYIEEHLPPLHYFFRDHRTGSIHPIDLNLLHLLVNLTQILDFKNPIHLISGYRSPQTNKKLASEKGGVAQNSQHLYGRAADIMIPGHPLKTIQRAAKSLKMGGVGRYVSFVHIDTGPVRSWGV